MLSGCDEEDESEGPRPVHIHPVVLFERLMTELGWDVSVVIDFLISNETCFLLYFLRWRSAEKSLRAVSSNIRMCL